MTKKKKSDKLTAKLSEIMKEAVGKKASTGLLQELEFDPEELRKITSGKLPVPTIAQLIVQKIIRMALTPTRSNQWCVEMVWERTEGKAPSSPALTDDGRGTEERLNDITTSHLNALAEDSIAAAAEAHTEELPSRLAEAQLEMSEDGTPDTQGLPGEPPVAKRAPRAG